METPPYKPASLRGPEAVRSGPKQSLMFGLDRPGPLRPPVTPYPNPLVEELGRQVRPGRPRDGVDAGVQRKEAKVRRVAEGLEDGALQFARKVDFALDPVAKTEPYDEAADIAGLN